MSELNLQTKDNCQTSSKNYTINLRKVLSPNVIDPKIHHFANKDELFHHMSNLFYKAGFVNDADGFVNALYQREEEGSTYMGNGLVIPHGRSEFVDKAGIGICRFNPMKYEGEAEELANYAVVLAIPKKVSSNEYMRILAKVACSLLDENVVDTVKNEPNVLKIIDVLSKKISENDEEN